MMGDYIKSVKPKSIMQELQKHYTIKKLEEVMFDLKQTISVLGVDTGMKDFDFSPLILQLSKFEMRLQEMKNYYVKNKNRKGAK